MKNIDKSKAIEYSEDYAKYLSQKSLFQKFIRKNFYINNILKHIKGVTIDFGCGVGDILEYLPVGSIGLEINDFALDICIKKGFNTKKYDAFLDNFNFTDFEIGKYKIFLASHVFEHFENSQTIFKSLFAGCNRIGIEKIVIIVPGHKGYIEDETHLTFITKSLVTTSIDNDIYFKLDKMYYYPFDSFYISKIIRHNELTLVFNKK